MRLGWAEVECVLPGLTAHRVTAKRNDGDHHGQHQSSAALHRNEGASVGGQTDNEKTVAIDHVAGIAVRHPLIVEVGHHYGITIATWCPGGSRVEGRIGSNGADRQSRPHRC